MAEEYQYTRAVVRKGKVPVTTKVLQGTGGIVNSHKDFAFNSFVLLYYSQILGLSASLVAIVIAISVLVDAVSDPIVGSLSDNFKSRFGRRHPFMIAAAIPFGLTMYFLFAPPALEDGWLLAWLFCFTIAARLAFTFFIVPWNAIAAEFSNDYVERTSIITYRYMVGWAGGLAFIVFTWRYLFPNTEAYPAGQLNPDSYQTFGLAVGGLVILWALISAFGTMREVPHLLQPRKATPRMSLKRTVAEVLLALGNANYRLLFVVSLLFFGLAGVGGVFDIYMNTYFWEFTPAELQWISLFSGLGAVGSFLFIPLLQRVIDKHTLLQWFLSIVMVGAMLKVCFRFWDIWPANGDPLLLQLLIVHAIVMTFLLTTCGIMVGSLIADLIDEQELHTGKRQEGVFSSGVSFAAKTTSSAGIIIGGLLLDHVIRFPTQAAVGEVGEDTLFRMALNDGVLIPALFFVPIYLMSKITMTRTRLQEVQAELGERRQEGGEEDTPPID